MPPAFFVQASQITNLADPEIMTGSTPTLAESGDVLLAVLVTPNSESIADYDKDAWEDFESLTSGTKKLQIFRRIVTDTEPVSHSFGLSNAPGDRPLGALLLYRGLNRNVADIDKGIVAVTASTTYAAPSVTLATYSDLMLLVYFETPTSSGGFTPQAGTTERIDFAGSGPNGRLMIADFLKESTGATGTKAALTSSSSGIAASILIAADATVGGDKAIAFSPPGAIGLPAEGV